MSRSIVTEDGTTVMNAPLDVDVNSKEVQETVAAYLRDRDNGEETPGVRNNLDPIDFVAKVIGLPIDLVTAVVNKFGADIENPVGGSKNIKGAVDSLVYLISAIIAEPIVGAIGSAQVACPLSSGAGHAQDMDVIESTERRVGQMLRVYGELRIQNPQRQTF